MSQKLKVIIMQGLPASGKSTESKKLVDKENYKRINKDDLRAMVDNKYHSKTNEKLILKARDSLLSLYLSSGRNVVVDDTNFEQYHIDRITEIASEYNAQVEVKFIDTPLDVCIERDKKRENGVGAHVIRSMNNKYIKKNKKDDVKDRYIQQDRFLPKAVIFDIDGTLALINPDSPRSPFDESTVSKDIAHAPVWNLIYELDDSLELLFVSGRTDSCFEDTAQWLLDKHDEFDMSVERGLDGIKDSLFMRKTGDTRNDAIVKKEIYEQNIKDKYNVLFVIDDRDRVVKNWRDELKLPCFQVWYGDF